MVQIKNTWGWQKKIHEGGEAKDKAKEDKENKERPVKKYQLLYDAASGEHRVEEWTQDEIDDWENSGYRKCNGHFDEIGLFDSEEELEKAIEELKGQDVFAVFEDKAAGKIYWAKENNLSGNWRGSKHGHATLIQEFDTQEEADAYVKKQRAEEE